LASRVTPVETRLTHDTGHFLLANTNAQAPRAAPTNSAAKVYLPQIVRPWRKVQRIKTATVDFGNGIQTPIRLLTYRMCITTPRSRRRRAVYRVEDIATGRQDLVGDEFINKTNTTIRQHYS